MEFYRLTIPIPTQPWRWIRFRITTVLLLVAIVAIALAWWSDRRRLTAALQLLQPTYAAWSVEQATGPPNTTRPGDIRTAWASATPDDQREWLLLEYEKAVAPVAILVNETYNPGAVFRVTHAPRGEPEQILWEGTDPTPRTAGIGMSRLPVTADVRTNRIKVCIDSPAVPGWNEIDAVGLEFGDENGTQVIWAKRAEASSTYGQTQSDVVFISGPVEYRR